MAERKEEEEVEVEIQPYPSSGGLSARVPAWRLPVLVLVLCTTVHIPDRHARGEG